MRLRRVRDLPLEALVPLRAEAAAAGCRLVGRLCDDWAAGTNRFGAPGEACYLAEDGNRVVGVCGLNRDPFTTALDVGRVRRLYVAASHRRQGLAQRLLEQVRIHAAGHFAVLHVRTFDLGAARLYESQGFVPCTGERVTHALRLAQPPPMPRLVVTERLAIRAPDLGEAAELNAVIAASLEALRPWMPWAQTAPTLAETAAHVSQTVDAYNQGRDYTLRLWLGATDELIGSSGLHRRALEPGTWEIGYWLRPSCAGQGLVTEAVRAITDLGCGLLAAERLEIRLDSRNQRSRAVAERAGYRLERNLPDHTGVDGEPTSTLVYVLFRDEWRVR